MKFTIRDLQRAAARLGREHPNSIIYRDLGYFALLLANELEDGFQSERDGSEDEADADALARIEVTLKAMRADLKEGSGCRFSSPLTEQQLVVAKGDRASGLNYLKRWLQGSNSLCICDPYLLHGNERITTELPSLLPSSLKSLGAVVNGNKVDPGTQDNLEAALTACGITLTVSHTPDLHDRVWIRNQCSAVVVGTSFNSLGLTNFSFILDLPREDLLGFQQELSHRGISPP